MTQHTTTNQPAARLRSGRVQCTIWQNGSPDKPVFGFELSRSYRDGEGNWRSTSRFDAEDAMAILVLSQEAHATIVRLRREAYAGEDTVDAG